MYNQRVETGVTHLDQALQGGLPLGSLTLVAGNPGTGKTILCGEFLYRGAADGENCLYVSLAEGREGFLEYMRRLGRDFDEPDTRGHLDIMDLVSVKEEGLDVLIEMITARIDAQSISRLVIDSFTALTNAFTVTIDARVTLHILSKILAQTGCTTLLVTEVPTGTARMGLGVEEFVADGVLHLRRGVAGGCTVRTLEVTKMRGTLIDRPLHLVSIHEGFKVIPLFQQTEIRKPEPYTPIPDMGESYSTGNRQLDSLTGGLRRGDTVYVELGDDISPVVPALLVGPLRASFLSQGRGVMFMPPGGESLERIHRFDQQFGLKPETRRNLRVATTATNRVDDPSALTLDPDSLEASQRTWAQAEARLTEETGAPALKIIYVDTIQNSWRQGNHKRFLDAESTATRSTGGLMILLSRPGGEALGQHASNLAHTHIKASNHEGVILLQGVKPRTPLYAAAQDDAMGYPSLSLTPIR